MGQEAGRWEPGDRRFLTETTFSHGYLCFKEGRGDQSFRKFSAAAELFQADLEDPKQCLVMMQSLAE